MVKRALLTLLVIVFVAGLSAGQVKTTRITVFPRTTIETYPEAERRPVLDYLDGARTVADKIISDFATERYEGLVSEFAQLEKATGQRIDVRDYANRIRRNYGSVTAYQFGCQVLESPTEKPDVSDAQRARSVAYYLIRTQKRPNGDLVLTVRTSLIGKAHTVSFFDINDYSGKEAPCLQEK
jgi:hypothetical protein